MKTFKKLREDLKVIKENNKTIAELQKIRSEANNSVISGFIDRIIEAVKKKDISKAESIAKDLTNIRSTGAKAAGERAAFAILTLESSIVAEGRPKKTREGFLFVDEKEASVIAKKAVKSGAGHAALAKYMLKSIFSAARPGSVKLGVLNALQTMPDKIFVGLDPDAPDKVMFVTGKPPKVYSAEAFIAKFRK